MESELNLNILYSNLIWNEKFWLPQNSSWEHLAKVNEGNVYNTFWYIFPIALLIYIIQHLVGKNVGIPLGKHFGLKVKSVRNNCDSVQSAALEKEFKLFGKDLLEHGDKLRSLVKKGLGEEREIKRWMRKRISQEKPSKLTRFGESLWKFLWHTSITLFGIYALWDLPWLWDIKLCWEKFPYQILPNTIKWYYIFSTSFILTQILTQLKAPRRSEHWKYLIHHFATFLLLTLSYMSNFTRIGSIILLIHDMGDILLHFCKMCDYTRNIRVGVPCFVLFAFVWIGTRIIVFPHVIYSSIIGTESIRAPVVTICIGMLCVLQVLHITWTYYLLALLPRVFSKDDSKKRDIRSDSDISE